MRVREETGRETEEMENTGRGKTKRSQSVQTVHTTQGFSTGKTITQIA